ncbi:ribonuclease III [Phanerochaete sordida]|uniref:Ribonuclease III n=1 Tax=Phanerochaete sordida TaxID=48140 RepID=A0A9P3FYL7_9APHY|nr:ribonuclease III [Phanerochaete sordida]
MMVVESSGLEFVEEPVTGKKITAGFAPIALERYLSSLRRLLPEDEHPSPPWCQLEHLEAQSYVLHLSLPQKAAIPAPLRRLENENPQGAREQACLSACKQLFAAGLLRDEFFSTNCELGDASNSTLDGHEVRQANHSTNTRCYPRKQPSFWTRALRTISSRSYPLVVSINPVGTFRDGPHAPMVILTRLPPPAFEAFPVFSNGEKAIVRFQLCAPFELDDKKRELLLRYTLRVSRALTNKPLECTEQDICYYLAPLDSTWDPNPSELAPWQLPKVDRHIAWHQVTEGAQRWATKLVPDGGVLTEETLEDCVVQDRAVEFTNRHYVLRLRPDLSPHSKMESSSADVEPATYLEYCKSRVKDFQGLKDHNQPLIEVSLAPPVVDTLAPASKAVPTAKNPARLLIPELCHRFVLPSRVWRTALLLPSVTHMMDRMLLTKEMRASYFCDAIGEADLLQAVTPVSANVEKDYERLELLGDTILKDILSTYFFVTMPTKREGALNAARSLAVSNRTLHEHAMTAGLTPWIQSKPMVVKLWAPYILHQDDAEKKGAEDPPDSRRRGKQQRLQDEQGVQWIGDKTVADVVEAIVGAAFRHGGMGNVLLVMKRLNFNLPEISEINDFWRVYTANLPSSTTLSNLPAKIFKAIGAITGVESIVPALLTEALTHGSLSGQKAASYDRLEFLGDGILDFNVAWYIFQAYPHLSPGGLSLLKAAMVSNTALAAVAVHSGLHEYIRCSSKEVASAIKLYAQKIIALSDQEYRDAEAESRLPNQFWLELDAPKSLADLVEAIIGAIYVSDHFETRGVETFFERVLRPFYGRHIRLHTLATHPSKSLFELLQAEGCQQHVMRKTNLGKEVRCEVIVHEVTVASAVEPTSNLSMRKAATLALDALTKDSEFLARACDCKTQKANSQGRKTQAKVHKLGYEVDP